MKTTTRDELNELHDHLFEIAKGYLERFGRDDIYYSLINSIDTIHDKLNN